MCHPFLSGTLCAALVLAGCTGEEQPGPQLDPVEQLEDKTGGAPLAGISEHLDLPIAPVVLSDLAGDTVGRAFQLFIERCSGCHDSPAPGSKPAGEWQVVIDRMHTTTIDAGLFPTSSEDRALILDYLVRHGGS
jgi:hypothetical protein